MNTSTITKTRYRAYLLLLLPIAFSGCFLTKILTVPMRVVGAVVSIVPVAGNTAHDAIDETAEIVDDVPI